MRLYPRRIVFLSGLTLFALALGLLSWREKVYPRSDEGLREDKSPLSSISLASTNRQQEKRKDIKQISIPPSRPHFQKTESVLGSHVDASIRLGSPPDMLKAVHKANERQLIVNIEKFPVVC
jgi:hypothetical protein